MIQSISSFVIQSSLALPSSKNPLAQVCIACSQDDKVHDLCNSTTPDFLKPMGVNVFRNFNQYWGIATALAIWFLLFHTPKFWKNRHLLQIPDLILAIHIITAATIYFACAHNCLITPSLHPLAKLSHTWIGRLGLVSGLISFSFGAFMAWSRLGSEGITLGFSIPITIGGILQINCEVNGFRAIRTYKSLNLQLQEDKLQLGAEERRELEEKKHKALRSHITFMLSLFVMACGIPAGIRLAEYIAGGGDSMFAIVMIVVVISVLQAVGGRYIHRMSPPPPNEPEEIGPIHPTSYNSIAD